MKNIDLEQLATVRGGIAGLLSAAGPILNGVASIIGAAKSKGGGGGGAPAAPPAGGAMTAAALAGPPPTGAGDDLVSVEISR